ncbi:hypothetical protein QMT40_002989 [Parvibaculaceae bacterium PLY_AMNH_Bact1]|nr:hypothetical protein QMT40_002989 [Parvibaculaceae bacterium PLY_AMNH_Bact1]
MPKFTVKTAVRHDDKDYAVDEEVNLTEEIAEPLLAVKAIEPVSKPEPKAAAK